MPFPTRPVITAISAMAIGFPAYAADTVSISTANFNWTLECTENAPVQTKFGPVDAPDTTKLPAMIVHPQQLSRYDNALNNFQPTLSVMQPNGVVTTYLNYVRHEQRTLDADRKQTDIFLKDSGTGVEVTLHFISYQHSDVISQSITYTNTGKDPVTLLKMASFQFNLTGPDLHLTTFNGKWAAEMQWQEQRIVPGCISYDSKILTHPTTINNPSFLISRGPAAEEKGWVVAGTLAWNGNWQLSFDTNTAKVTAVSGGLNSNQPYVLRPTTSLDTPMVLLTASSSGSGQTSRNFHRWARQYGLSHTDETKPVILNSWDGAAMNFDEKRLLAMMDGTAAVGGEMFVLDDGWFGNKYPRNKDNAGLGDWQANRAKLPNGLQWLSEQAKQRGLKFGLWVEPEMVNPKSELFEKHPEWVAQIPGHETRLERTQWPLDMTNPAVQDFVYQTVSGILKENPGISYLKWDNNGQVTEPGSTYLGQEGQSRFPVEFIHGYDKVMTRLTKEFPNIPIQACASGGGRVNYGALPYHSEYWASDNQNPLVRLKMMWGYSHFFPTYATACHIADTFKSAQYNLKFRTDVAMTARLGIELDPSHMKPENIAILRKGIEAYKQLRPLLHSGDLYRGLSPYASSLTTSSVVSADRKAAVFFAFQQEAATKAGQGNATIPGLDPAKTYQLKEINPGSEPRIRPTTRTGKQLMETGIEIQWPAGCQSTVVELTGM